MTLQCRIRSASMRYVNIFVRSVVERGCAPMGYGNYAVRSVEGGAVLPWDT